MAAVNESPDTWSTHPMLHLMVESTVTLALLTLAYMALPLQVQGGSATFLVRLLVSALAFVGIGLGLRAHVRHSRRVQAPAYLRLEYLLALLYVLVLGFALMYVVTERVSPDQFDGVTGRVSALYLSMTVVSTVGMGDVHSRGTVGQLMVTAQMLFDTVYLGTAIRVLTSRAAPVQQEPPRD